MKNSIRKIQNYLSLVKFSHTIFAMPFALIGFTLGVTENPSNQWWVLLSCVVLCMVFARNAAMAFNRYIDAQFDAKNPRTASREIPANIIKPSNAKLFVIINCMAFVVTTHFINPICFYLSPVALIVILVYSLTKRFTALCHLVLGVGLSLAPIGAFLAVVGKFELVPILFSFIVFFWVSGFDIIYALQDKQFDQENKLNSIPVLMGIKGALSFSIFLHTLTFALVGFAGYYAHFGLFYWIGAIIFCSMLIYQHLIVKPNDLSRVNLAFGTTNGVASIIFGVFVIIEILMK